MQIIKRFIPAAAALLILLGTAACSEQTDTPQSSAAETAQTAPAADTQTVSETENAQPETAMTEPAAEPFDPSRLPAITLTSADLHDGVWDPVITNTANGSNRSPQLSWQPVEGAACYAVYMVDTTANYWLHWKSLNISETELAAGAASGEEYIGPYPPSGTHDYEIRVYALKEPAQEEKSKFDSGNSNFETVIAALDETGSGAGNVLACGTLTGTYTYTRAQ